MKKSVLVIATIALIAFVSIGVLAGTISQKRDSTFPVQPTESAEDTESIENTEEKEPIKVTVAHSEIEGTPSEEEELDNSPAPPKIDNTEDFSEKEQQNANWAESETVPTTEAVENEEETIPVVHPTEDIETATDSQPNANEGGTGEDEEL